MAALLIELHGADGQRYWLNPAEITTAREPSARDLQQHFATGARCIVLTTDGKFIATRETCDVVRERAMPGGQPRPEPRAEGGHR